MTAVPTSLHIAGTLTGWTERCMPDRIASLCSRDCLVDTAQLGNNNSQEEGLCFTTISSLLTEEVKLDDYNSSGFLDGSGSECGSSHHSGTQPSASA